MVDFINIILTACLYGIIYELFSSLARKLIFLLLEKIFHSGLIGRAAFSFLGMNAPRYTPKSSRPDIKETLKDL